MVNTDFINRMARFVFLVSIVMLCGCEHPTMAGIMGVFKILWVYHGLLILSRPVIAWNMVAVVINFLSVWVYFQFARSERNRAKE